jgi:hypothetical protein
MQTMSHVGFKTAMKYRYTQFDMVRSASNDMQQERIG